MGPQRVVCTDRFACSTSGYERYIRRGSRRDHESSNLDDKRSRSASSVGWYDVTRALEQSTADRAHVDDGRRCLGYLPDINVRVLFAPFFYLFFYLLFIFVEARSGYFWNFYSEYET